MSRSIGSGHLHGDNRHGRDARGLVEGRGVIPQEFTNNLRLAHASIAVKEQAGHSIARGIGEQVFQPRQLPASLLEIQPAIRPDPSDSFVVGETRLATIGGQEMAVFAQDHSSIS